MFIQDSFETSSGGVLSEVGLVRDTTDIEDLLHTNQLRSAHFYPHRLWLAGLATRLYRELVNR